MKLSRLWRRRISFPQRLGAPCVSAARPGFHRVAVQSSPFTSFSA